jgi:hypothetical protein
MEDQLSEMNTVLRQSECFSMSSKMDLEMLLGTPPLRHLPMANLIIRERTVHDQLDIDMKYFQAASTCNADGMADALDAGADLNTTQKNGDRSKNALQLCIDAIQKYIIKYSNDALDLSLLSHETQVILDSADVCEMIRASARLGLVEFPTQIAGER